MRLDLDLCFGTRLVKTAGLCLLLPLFLFIPHKTFAQQSGQSVSIKLPNAFPSQFSTTIMLNGSSQQIHFEKFSLRSPSFRVRVYHKDGSTTSVAPPPVSTYRGFIQNDPDYIVTATLRDSGLWANISKKGIVEHKIEPQNKTATNRAPQHLLIEESLPDPVNCGTCTEFSCKDKSHSQSNKNPQSTQTTASSTSGATPFGPGQTPVVSCDMKKCEIAFDCDFEYFTQQGSDVMATVMRVEEILNDVDYFYARDLMITYELTDVIVRTASYYSDISGGGLLDDFRAEWNSVQAGVQKDIAHLMTNKTNLSGYAGLAWVGVVCTSSAYGWSLDSAGVVGHEVGHNWASGHCHDQSPCNNMCGACLNIQPNTLAIMNAHKASRTCLDVVASYPTDLPPYGNRDQVQLTEAELLTQNPIVLDVLANDHDGNCDGMTLSSFDTVSEKGGSISRSVGSGPGGRDELIYTPPLFGYAGNDLFYYEVSDGLFNVSTEVVINVTHPQLVAHWKLDELTGLSAQDATGHGHTGSLNGSLEFATSGTIGQFDRALDFNGIDDSVELPRLDLQTDTCTMTMWVRRNGAQAQWAGLMVSRAGSTTAGLTLGTHNELRYLWNGAGYTWDPNMEIPDQQWVFVALVIEANQATFYLHDGSLQSSSLAATHGIEEFDSRTQIAWDENSPSRRFKGQMDDLRIYSGALSQSQIENIIAGGSSEAPNPPNLDNSVSIDPLLSWNPGNVAQASRFYFGIDEASVAAATPNDPEYKGTTTSSSLFLQLANNSRYFWRADSIVGNAELTNYPWSFQTNTAQLSDNLEVHLSCNAADISGSTLIDTAGGNNATLQNGAAASTGYLDGAIELDGVNDRATIPALNLNTNTVTLSAWVLRDGPQDDWSGIIFCRAGNTAAGLNIGTGNMLRYHWNSGEWGWNSGLLVPDGEWAHVMLVVEPGLATIYLNGVPALHPATHDIEEFDGEIRIGEDPLFGCCRNFDGKIDDIGIWSRALSPVEVRNVYQRGLIDHSFAGTDNSPPVPNPTNWTQVPTVTSPSSIVMEAELAIDPSGVEYYFTCVTGPGNDSGWQSNPRYEDTGLMAGTEYTYSAQSRDLSPAANTSLASTAESATTPGTNFKRGDCNNDTSFDIADIIFLLGVVFPGPVSPGPVVCEDACDGNDDGSLNIADAITMLSALFVQPSQDLPEPYPDCATDPTADSLGCGDNTLCI